MQNKKFNLGPLALSGTLTTNILNPPTATGGTNGGSSSAYILLNWIRLANVTGSAVTVNLYKSTTGDNTLAKAICFQLSVPANSYVDVYPGTLRFDAADFLVGGCSTGAAVNIIAGGEIGVAG